jgi:threonine aldolase
LSAIVITKDLKMFLSDNTAPASPEIWQYVQQHAQNGYDLPYGDDALTAKLNDCVSTLFGQQAYVFPVLTGTAANCLALGQMCHGRQSIICHPNSHLAVSESTAPQLFTGGARLSTVGADLDNISASRLKEYLQGVDINDIHSPPPAALAITQATEFGRCYSIEQMNELGKICQQHNLKYFVDGARFANAVAHFDCHPADLSCRAGVDAMTFGASKNGTFGAEALVVFNPLLASGIRAHAKQTGHLASKMRFLSAQLLGYFDNNLWLDNARHANNMAALVAKNIAEKDLGSCYFAAQTNQLFIAITSEQYNSAKAQGYDLYHWPVEGQDCYRLVTSWVTKEQDVAGFIAAISL